MIMSVFPCRDLGRLSEFLGVAVRWFPGGVALSQCAYVERLLAKFCTSDQIRGVSVPLEQKLVPEGTLVPDADQQLYRKIIGTTGYLAIMTRPDISHAQGHFGRFLGKATEDHMAATGAGESLLASELGGLEPMCRCRNRRWRRSWADYFGRAETKDDCWVSHDDEKKVLPLTLWSNSTMSKSMKKVDVHEG